MKSTEFGKLVYDFVMDEKNEERVFNIYSRDFHSFHTSTICLRSILEKCEEEFVEVLNSIFHSVAIEDSNGLPPDVIGEGIYYQFHKIFRTAGCIIDNAKLQNGNHVNMDWIVWNLFNLTPKVEIGIVRHTKRYFKELEK